MVVCPEGVARGGVGDGGLCLVRGGQSPPGSCGVCLVRECLAGQLGGVCIGGSALGGICLVQGVYA